jgi:hypothetical protein
MGFVVVGVGGEKAGIRWGKWGGRTVAAYR